MIPVLYTIDEVRRSIKAEKRKGKSIGFVPTMGYLHEGHLSLITKSKAENDITIVSVFVNPTQFAANEDFNTYPRDFKHDLAILNDTVDYIFLPTQDTIYPEDFSSSISVTKYSSDLCAVSRPSHFDGVAIIVAKLINIVAADKIYLGQKDMQQFLIIRQMIKDLNFDIEAVACPIVRENDGLALSSRNIYLTAKERQQATVLYQALKAAEKLVHDGETRSFIIYKAIKKIIDSQDLAEIDYIEIKDIDSWRTLDNFAGKNTLIALAVKFGKTRLLDNIIIYDSSNPV